MWPPVYTPDVPDAVNQPFPSSFGPQPNLIDGTGQAVNVNAPWPPVPYDDAMAGAPNQSVGDPTVPPQGQVGTVAPAPAPPPVDASPGQLPPEHGAADRPYPPVAPPQTTATSPYPEVDANSGGETDTVNHNGGSYAQPNSPEEEYIARKYGIQAKSEDEESQGNVDAIEELKRNEKKAQEEDARDEAARTKAREELGTAVDKVNAMQVDPNHYMSSRTGMQKVGMLIGSAIGGFLAVRQQTGHNAFLDGINQAIQQDIDVQQANIANARAGVAQKQSIYSMYVDQLHDAKAARHAAAGTMFDITSRQVAAKAARYKSPYTQNEAQGALIALKKASDAEYGAAHQQLFENKLKLSEQNRKNAETLANILKTRAETAKIQREGKDANVVPVVVHGPGGTLPLELDPKRAAIIEAEQKELDKAADQRREHFKDKTNNEGWVRKYDDQLKRSRDVLRSYGVDEAEVFRVFPDWKEDDVAKGDKTPIEFGKEVVPNGSKGVAAPKEAMKTFEEAPPPDEGTDLTEELGIPDPFAKPKKRKK